MKIESVFDSAFSGYGRVWNDVPEGLLVQFLEALEARDAVSSGTEYVADDPVLRSLAAASELEGAFYGGRPAQFGCVCGRNVLLNSLEYHRSSEFNLPSRDVILLLAKREQLREDFTLPTSEVRAFRVPAGTLIEVYGDTMHYTPCCADPGIDFRMLVVLPEGTNGPRPEGVLPIGDGKILWGADKWVITHESTKKAAEGCHVGLIGENLDVTVAL